MRVISLVIEGLEQAANTGCLEWLFAQDADIICLQDTVAPNTCSPGMLSFRITTTRTFWIITTIPASTASPSTASSCPKPSSGVWGSGV